MSDITKEQEEYEKNFPIKDFKKMVFTFTREELTRMLACETNIMVAAMMKQNAENLLTTIFNNICLPRVGVVNTPEIGKYTDTTKGIFYVYVPRSKDPDPKKK